MAWKCSEGMSYSNCISKTLYKILNGANSFCPQNHATSSNFWDIDTGCILDVSVAIFAKNMYLNPYKLLKQKMFRLLLLSAQLYRYHYSDPFEDNIVFWNINFPGIFHVFKPMRQKYEHVLVLLQNLIAGHLAKILNALWALVCGLFHFGRFKIATEKMCVCQNRKFVQQMCQFPCCFWSLS